MNVTLHATPSQTVGPFFSVGLDWLNRNELAGSGVSGERVTVEGRVLDGDGQPVPDALLEVWQANAHGRYAHPEDTQDDKPHQAGFMGYGRIPTDEDGRFRIRTIRPGPVAGPGGTPQAPHILVSLFARGLMRRLVTRVYFPDQPENERDFALSRVEPARRATLIAKRTGAAAFEWNVILQGADETVFFDL